MILQHSELTNLIIQYLHFKRDKIDKILLDNVDYLENIILTTDYYNSHYIFIYTSHPPVIFSRDDGKFGTFLYEHFQDNLITLHTFYNLQNNAIPPYYHYII